MRYIGYFEYDDKHIYHMHHNDRLSYDLANILAYERVKAPGTYGVYVIELDGDPEHVYVGQSVRVPEKRLAQHNSGTRQQFAAAVFRRGACGRLRPDLYGHLKRVKTQDQAKVLEAKVAAELEAAGYQVEGGH